MDSDICQGIGLPLLVAVELESDFVNPQSGLQLNQISFLSQVYARVTPSTVSNAFKLLQLCIDEYGPRFQVLLNVTALSNALDDVEKFLEIGCSKIFVTFDQLRSLFSRNPNIPPSRFVLSVNNRNTVAVETIRSEVDRAFVKPGTTLGGIHIYNLDDFEKQTNFLSTAFKFFGFNGSPRIYAAKALKGSLEVLLDLENKNLSALWDARALTMHPTRDPSLMPVSKLLTSGLRPDASGLYPTMVTNEYGIGLGLVFSNEESIAEALATGTGVYWSRSRKQLWRKGATSGDIQELVSIHANCNSDSLQVVVKQHGRGFCHTPDDTCYGPIRGLVKLQQTLKSRLANAPAGSYTARLFSDRKLLNAKIKEEADELIEATEKKHIAFEAADVMYFALVKCIAEGVDLKDIGDNLDLKHLKCKRRKGDAKPKYLNGESTAKPQEAPKQGLPQAVTSGPIRMARYVVKNESPATIKKVLQRPAQGMSDLIMSRVTPIVSQVREHGDAALLKFTNQLDIRCPDPVNAPKLKTPIIRAPFPEHLMQLPAETKQAIDISFENIRKFHAAQAVAPLHVETMPGVVCSRFARPIERVGLYIPGGTAVLPSTSMMLGVPAMVAGCKEIVLASPPRTDCSISPEIVYVAHKVGASTIVLAGGSQAVAAMAYGTESVPKVDKILGPGNQYVTAAKMLVSNDTSAQVSIDMPAGPSEVLVIADENANPAFVAADLLSQAEHGVDSQVVLIAINLNESQLSAIEKELDKQASVLPRVKIVRQCIAHSVTLVVSSLTEAFELSNHYAPEHLILQITAPEKALPLVNNAGSVFVGPWTPESVGDYSAGVNHSLPTYGYAKQYSGVNLGSFTKHITASNLSADGLRNVGTSVMRLAAVEQLDAHRRAVEIRVNAMDARSKL